MTNRPGMSLEPLPASRSLLVACRVAACLTMAVSLLVLVGGWLLGDEELKNLVPGTVAMKPLTAFGLIAAAVGLLVRPGEGSGRSRIVADVVAACVLLLGVVVLLEFLADWNIGIDELLFTDRASRALGVPYPGRPAPTTAACFVLIGLALLSMDAKSLGRWRPSELLVVPVAGMASMTIVGYLYAIPDFYGPASAAKMALNTASGFLALALGIVLARPRGRLVALASTDDAGGTMFRRTTPPAVVIPLLLGWLTLQAKSHGVIGERLGIWWLSAATIVALVLLIARVSARLSQDAEERRRLEAEMVVLANHDCLTGLYNRRRFDAELTRAASQAARGHMCSLLVLDFDRMKAVNDTLGHAAGDRLLEAVGQIFRDRVRSSDIAGRLGGDEFGILLHATAEERASVMADQLRRAVATCRVSTPRGEAWTTVSIGIAEFTDDRFDSEGVMAEADHAMYLAKREGGNRTVSFEAVRLIDSSLR